MRTVVLLFLMRLLLVVLLLTLLFPGGSLLFRCLDHPRLLLAAAGQQSDLAGVGALEQKMLKTKSLLMT